MKVTKTAINVKPDHYLNVSCDVHKKVLCFLARLPGCEYSDTCKNRTHDIERKLRQFAKIAREHGKQTIRVVCEPTGEYDRGLLRTAHRLEFLTAYVNTENVKKYRQIETNDDGKTDTKDPRVISSLADQERVIRIRDLDEKYMTLRKLGAVAEEEEVAVVRIKNRLHREIFNFFADYDMKKDFLYTKSGRALVRCYVGVTKNCKKGRSRARKVLGNIVLPLVPRHKLYGTFYHHKRDVDRMCGNKAMVVVMRNFLRKFWGWYQAGGGEFDETRWFTCESQAEDAA